MKRLMVYEDFSSQEKTDELLDKISKYGITSLTGHEKDFLDAVSSGDDERVQNKMKILSNDTFFEDDFFKFELDDIKYKKNGIQYIGTLYVPDLEKPHKTIEGNFELNKRRFSNGYWIDFTHCSVGCYSRCDLQNALHTESTFPLCGLS